MDNDFERIDTYYKKVYPNLIGQLEKEALITNLRDILEKTSKVSQLERKSQEAGFLQDTLKMVPMVIFVG